MKRIFFFLIYFKWNELYFEWNEFFYPEWRESLAIPIREIRQKLNPLMRSQFEKFEKFVVKKEENSW